MKKLKYALIACSLIAAPAFAADNMAKNNMSMDMKGMDMKGMDMSGHNMSMDIMTNPKDGAVLPKAPRAITVQFMHEMMLQTVKITGPNNKPVNASFKRPAKAMMIYNIALPPLTKGTYNVSISANGMGHTMNKAFSFSVK